MKLSRVEGQLKRVAIILCCLLILLIPLLGCLPSKPAAPVTSQKDQDQDANIQNLKDRTASLDENKASKSYVTDMVQSVKSQINTSVDTYTKSQLYTKSEVDSIVSQKVADAIKALKDNQDWIKGGVTTPSGGTTTSPTGTVQVTTNPVSIPQIYSASSGSGQSTFYTMRIVNSSTVWQYVKPIVSLTVASSYSSRSVTGITVTMSTGSCSMTGSRTSADAATSSIGNFSISPNVGNGATTTSSLTIIPVSGCNGTGEIQIGAGQSVDVLIQITGLTTSDVTLWNVSNSHSSRVL
jgi:hypothetical protein